jgi:hypothetical protein
MKRAIVLLAVFLVVFAAMLPSPASADNWHRGHRGHFGWWWPGALVGGLVFGAVVVATAPIWALSAAAASITPPPPAYAPAPAYAAPPAYYAAPPVYSAPPSYSAAPSYSAPPSYSAAGPSYPQTAAYAPAPRVQREVVYPNGRYVLYGDGVSQPWQWVWVWATTPPPAPPSLQTLQTR